MKLEAHELLMLAEYFEGVEETVAILSKKNGKTTLLAALALDHLETRQDAAVYIGASSRDQATILFEQAAGLVDRSKLSSRFDVKGGYRHIRLKSNPRARIRVMAADARTADGVIPTLALVDELHRHPSGELYGVFRDGLGPRSGQMLTISTAGATVASPLGMLRDKAHSLPNFTRVGAYNHASTEDGSFVFHEWCLRPDDDPTDMKLVKTANPASWHTVAKLQKRHDSPSTTPWQWLRFACGVWTEGEEPWIEPQQWDDLEGEVKLGSEPVRMVVHLGHRAESAAIAMIQPAGEQVLARVHLYESTTLASLEESIRSLCEEFNVDSVAYNNRVFQRSAETLQAEGVPMIEFPQSLERMTQVAASFYKLIEEKRLVHDGDPDLRLQVLAGRVKEMEQGWRFIEDPRLPRPIVGLIALAIGCFQVEEAPTGAMMFGFA